MKQLKLSVILCLFAFMAVSSFAQDVNQVTWSRMAAKGIHTSTVPIKPSQFTAAIYPASGALLRDYVSYRLSHHTFGSEVLVYLGETSLHRSGAAYIHGFAGLTLSAKADSYAKVTYNFRFNHGVYNGCGYGLWGVKSEFLYYGSVNPMNYALQGNCSTRSGGSNGVQTLSFLNKHNGLGTPPSTLTYNMSAAINHSITVDNSNGTNVKTDTHYYGVHAVNGWAGESMYDTSLSYTLTGRTVTYYKHVTFDANGGTGTMNKQTVAGSANLSTNTFNREGFTFAGWNTKADGTGDPYANGAQIVANVNSKGPVTLFAQWTALPITAKFDYTYRTSDVVGGQETYVHMEGEHEGAAITKNVRAILRDHKGEEIKKVVLTAPAATVPTGDITSDISTHKTASLTLNVVKGTEESLSINGSDYTLTLDATNYANYRTVDFEVMNAGGDEVAPHWVSDKVDATNYLFKYEGHSSDNMFRLTWRVNLEGLSMYPSDIFVKPMRKGTHSDNGGSTTLEQIPAMTGIDGIECKFAGYIDGDKTKGAYYEGEYQVLKTCAHGNDYNYQLGLTGFILDGDNYYLAAKHGDIPEDMISTAVATKENASITFNRTKVQIPVLILNPNGENATVGGKTNYMLYVDNGTKVDGEGKRIVNLDQFEAIRPNYDFVGWVDTYDGTDYEVNGDYHFNIGTKATTTLVAQWKRTNAPSVVNNGVIEDENNFIYNIRVTDEFNDIKSVKYIYTDNDTEPAADASGWYDMDDTQNDGIYTHTIPQFNEYSGNYLWVKAANTDKSNIIYLGEIRSIYKVKANPDPDSHTTEVIPNGTWSEPENEEEKPEFIQDTENPTTTVHYYDYYSTFYFGERTFIANNASVFTAQINGNHLDLTEIKPASEDAPVIIPKGTAVILRKKHDTDGNIVLEEYNGDVPTLDDTNNLSGVDVDTTQNGDNYYIFSYAQKGLGFYQNSSTTLAAHKAFIQLENGQSAARAFTLNFGDSETTGINDIETDVDSNALYDLSGRKVSAPSAQGGIYIKGGKKIIIKK